MPLSTPGTWIEINAAAFDHNVRQYKRAIGSASLSAVVKANAYGHGIELISRLAQKHELIDQLCVATASEAILLKKIGITKPILILSFIDVDPEQLIDTGIELTVGDDHTIERLNTIGIAHNYRFPVHLKIDTGLSRFGFEPEKALFYGKKISVLDGFELRGIYSHCAESPHHDQTFTLHQRSLFKKVVDEYFRH